MLFALDRLIVARQWRDASVLAAGFALQALSSIYLMVFSAWMLLFASLARIRELWSGGGAALKRVAAAGILAALVLSPYLAEYAAVSKTMGFARAADEEEAASWANYVSTGSRLHFQSWSRHFTGLATSNTFPGIAALALVVIALSERQSAADPRFRMCAVVAAGCVAVSFAPLLPFYRSLHAAIPLFQAVRVLAHIGQLVLLMVAILAGYGVTVLQRGWTHAGFRGRWRRRCCS